MNSTLERIHEKINKCRECEKYGLTINKPPSMNRGTESSKIMIIGLAPSRTAIEKEIAFFGNSFNRLTSWLRSAGYTGDAQSLRSHLYLTSVNKCAVTPDTEAQRTKLWINCRTFLWQQIEELAPKSILILGQEPAKKILGTITNWNTLVGTYITTREIFGENLIEGNGERSKWLILPHPSGLSRTMNDETVRTRVFESLKPIVNEIEIE